MKHCWLCDVDVVLDPDGTCPDCGRLWRDPADGPTQAEIEWAMNYVPPRPFTMLDKDYPERYRP